MITRIFSKSKPINFVIVVSIIILLFVTANYELIQAELSMSLILQLLIKLLVVVFSVFILDFIVSKNNLTQRNSYAIMSLALLLALFPSGLMYQDVIIANVFVLLAFRRLISLQSKLYIQKKLFDAAFWIALASLLYPWAILFFIVIIIAVVYYSQNDVKNVLVPFSAILTVFIILVAYNIIKYDTYFTANTFNFQISTDFSRYNNMANIIALTMILVISVWTMLYFLRVLRDRPKKMKPLYAILTWWYLVAFIIALIAPDKNQSEFMLLMAPLSIIIANYLEVITERWFKESIVILLALTPIIMLLL